jgi:hypothetical protein
MRPRRSALPLRLATGASCADIDREDFARWRVPRTAVYAGPYGLDRPLDTAYIHSKAQVCVLSGLLQVVEVAEPEPPDR